MFYSFHCRIFLGYVYPQVSLFGGVSYCNETTFLISFLCVSLLVHVCATHFYIVILYFATLLNSFFLVGFFVESLGFSIYIYDRATCKQRQFNFLLFPIQLSFLAFAYQIPLARTSSIMMNKSGKSGHTCSRSQRKSF